MEKALVESIMSRDVLTVTSDVGTDVAVELMRSHGIRRLPVVSDTGRVIGMITVEEARLALPDETRNEYGFNKPGIPPVKEVMSDFVYSVGPRDSVGVAARRMVNHKIGALPVLEEHKLVGIVTESDIFRFVADQLEPEEAGSGGVA
jgi:acetoin utilization protein AcuB